jgi:hypothetical protein
MLLYLKHAISLSGNDEHSFFRSAYYWRFKKILYTDSDALQYRLHAVVPKYVEEYVIHLQEGGGLNLDSEEQTHSNPHNPAQLTLGLR